MTLGLLPLSPSPALLQDVDAAHASTAELQAKAHSLTDEIGFLRTLFDMVTPRLQPHCLLASKA